MDLKYRVNLPVTFLLLASLPLFGAAKLRLSTTALAPISINAGSNGATQTVNAINAGDTALNLSAASSVAWMAPTVGALTPCSAIGKCIPISIALNTASLAKGSYTGFITVSDPNAIDAPQNISVTVAIGGGVPDSMTFYVPAGGAAVSQQFSAGGNATATPTAPQGTAPSLTVAPPSVSLGGAGSFGGTYTYTVTSQAAAGVAANSYTGSIAVTGSPVSNENKTVPVTINVTTGPIASPSTSSLSFRIAQNAVSQLQNIVFSNPGSGTLSIAKADVTTTSGTWLTATPGSYYVTVKADPTGLAPGVYPGSVTITTNAANATVTVPVTLTVAATTPPVTTAGGVVHNGTFTNDELAQGDFPAVFGEQFTTGDPVLATNVPYPTTVGGTTVYVNDTPVPLYYVSAGQINFLLPFDAVTGNGTLRVDRDGVRGNTVSISIVAHAPKLLVATNAAGQTVAYALSAPFLPVKAGDYITLYGFGFGQTTPATTTNAASSTSSLVHVPGTNTAYFGTSAYPNTAATVTPQFLGLAPGLVTSFYQVNVQIPSNAPKGSSVPVYLVGDSGTTNQLLLNIQ